MGKRMKNKDLKKIYDENKLSFHSGFEESMMLISMIDDWQGKSVLEIGCGEGNLCAIMHYAGASVQGIDYSEQQIRRGCVKYPQLALEKSDFKQYTGDFDIVVMQGVLEHLDSPFKDMSWIFDNFLTAPAGTLLVSVPNWTNPRGYVYHTLRLLLDAKMSLTDLHYFLPSDFACYASQNNHEITMQSCDFRWASEDEMIKDLADRIPKAVTFKNTGIVGIENKIEDNLELLLKYLAKMAELYQPNPLSGANLGVKITKSQAKLLTVK